MKSRSLRFQFLLLYVFLAVLSGIIVPALGVRLSMTGFRKYQIERRNADLESLGESLTRLYEEEGNIWKRRRVMDILRPAPQWMGMKIVLLDEEHKEIFTLHPMQQMNHMQQMNMNGHRVRMNIAPQEESENLEHITIKLGRDKSIGTLEIDHAIPSGRFERAFILYLMQYTLGGAFIVIIFACGIGYLVAERLSRPVIKAIERTEKISRGEYDSDEKLQPVGIRELDALTRGVEDLARSLAGQEKLRRRLMVDVSHELRTPLTVVRTQIEAIADGILKPEPERLNICVKEMSRLGDLIRNIDALTRLEGETLEIHTQITDMKKFLAPVLETFRPVFEKDGIKFSGSLEENCACEIDRDKFRHVIDNLLSNAQRYTNPGGSVDVKLFSKERKVIIEVRDTGIGISEKDLPNIFERFYRADESRTRVTGGNGVGLAIVKAAVEAHGGKVFAQSEKGKGSCFTIELPAV